MIRRIISRKCSRYAGNMADYRGFKRVLDNAENIVVLTGAGISAESGIPLFRGRSGLWRRYNSVDLACLEAFQANPSLVWEFYNWRRDVAFNAQPNKAHLALVEYEKICLREDRKFTVITQNVDNLHNRAGSKNVLELHGNLSKVICTNCRAIDIRMEHPICDAFRDRGDPHLSQMDLPIIPRRDLPKCKDCKGMVRPFIVWFGEHVNRTVLAASRELVESCDLCLVIGTSSLVYPAAMFAPTVAERGMPVAEFNILQEPAKETFQFYFSGRCSVTLPRALQVNV